MIFYANRSTFPNSKTSSNFQYLSNSEVTVRVDLLIESHAVFSTEIRGTDELVVVFDKLVT